MRPSLRLVFGVGVLLSVLYVDYKLETDSSSAAHPRLVHLQLFSDKAFLFWFLLKFFSDKVFPLVLGSSRIPPPVLIYDWSPLRAMRDYYRFFSDKVLLLWFSEWIWRSFLGGTASCRPTPPRLGLLRFWLSWWTRTSIGCFRTSPRPNKM